MFDFYPLGYPFYEVTRANLTTLGKDYQYMRYLEMSKEQQMKKWDELLIAEHSTLAFAPFIVTGDFRSDVMHQIARATKGLPRFAVESQRPDWVGKERPSHSSLRKAMTLWNPISWMAMCRDRLCRLAMAETRETITTICDLMRKSEDPFFNRLGYHSIPMCVYRNGCPYGKRTCGYRRPLGE